MKKTLVLIVYLFIFGKVSGQRIQEMASMNLDEAILNFEKRQEFKSFNTVKLVGLGDVGLLAKESKKLNSSFAAYLISRKQFRNVVLMADDWLVRTLNSYLTSSSPRDTSELNTLLKSIFDSNYQYLNSEFRSFLTWVKYYNSEHPRDMVNLFGVAPKNRIPPSYFLSTYIYPIDEKYGQMLSAKWTDNITSDSVAYTDIKMWIYSYNKQSISKQNRDLISRCSEDLLHNKSVLKRKSVDQKFSRDTLNNRNRFVVDQILKRLNKKTIFLGLNREVVKADLESIVVMNDLAYSSIGNYLNDVLAQKYLSILTDFAESAKLYVVDPFTQKMGFQTVVGSEQAKSLYAKGDYFELTRNGDLLRGYKPAYLSPTAAQDDKITVEKNHFAFDGLFILPTISQIELLY